VGSGNEAGADVPTPTDAPEARRVTPVVVILGLAFGALFGGFVGAAVAAIGIGIVWWRGPRTTVGIAIACLVVSALAAVTETGLPDNYDNFGLDRPIAAQAARAAGILAMVALIAFARRERAPRPAR
jgi:hypothetical protein